jgi:hypothetical protein
MDLWESFAKYAPQYLPLLGAILVILFTRNYVYKGMVPESILNSQLERESKRLQEQSARDKQIIEGAKDIEAHLEELVRQLEALTLKVSAEIGENNVRVTSLERFLSDQIDAIRDLTANCERHRREILNPHLFNKEATT